jgi:hypothetical protein
MQKIGNFPETSIITSPLLLQINRGAPGISSNFVERQTVVERFGEGLLEIYRYIMTFD